FLVAHLGDFRQRSGKVGLHQTAHGVKLYAHARNVVFGARPAQGKSRGCRRCHAGLEKSSSIHARHCTPSRQKSDRRKRKEEGTVACPHRQAKTFRYKKGGAPFGAPPFFGGG